MAALKHAEHTFAVQFSWKSSQQYLVCHCCTHTVVHPYQNNLNWGADELEWIIDQLEITNGFLHSLRLEIYRALGNLLGIIEVCNTVKWSQNKVLIICLYFNPFPLISIATMRRQAPPFPKGLQLDLAHISMGIMKFHYMYVMYVNITFSHLANSFIPTGKNANYIAI